MEQVTQPTNQPHGLLYTVSFVIGLLLIISALYILYNAIRWSRGEQPLDWFGTTPGGVGQSTGAMEGNVADIATLHASNQVPIDSGAGTEFSPYMFNLWVYVHNLSSATNRVVTIYKTKIEANRTLTPSDEVVSASFDGLGQLTTTLKMVSGSPVTATIPQFPLQTWVAVTISVGHTNLSVYLNGRIAGTTAYGTGTPHRIAGQAIIGGASSSGFNGQVCNASFLYKQGSKIDAETFAKAGTSCSPTPIASGAVKQTTVMKIFGYTLTFGVLDKTGAEIKKYTF